MGLCKTSNFSIFAFINASDLKFCTRSYSSCVYRMMRFKGSNGKVSKMMTSHFRTLLARGFGANPVALQCNTFCKYQIEVLFLRISTRHW